MISFLPRPLHGLIMAILLLTNTVFWVSQLYILVILKLILPIKSEI